MSLLAAKVGSLFIQTRQTRRLTKSRKLALVNIRDPAAQTAVFSIRTFTDMIFHQKRGY